MKLRNIHEAENRLLLIMLVTALAFVVYARACEVRGQELPPMPRSAPVLFFVKSVDNSNGAIILQPVYPVKLRVRALGDGSHTLYDAQMGAVQCRALQQVETERPAPERIVYRYRWVLDCNGEFYAVESYLFEVK